MENKFIDALNKCYDHKIKEISAVKCDSNSTIDSSMIYLVLENEVSLYFNFWRLISSEDQYSSFSRSENKTIYEKLVDDLKDARLKKISLISPSNDLEIIFYCGKILQIFSFTNYEDWAVNFPNGTTEYSNYQRL